MFDITLLYISVPDQPRGLVVRVPGPGFDSRLYRGNYHRLQWPCLEKPHVLRHALLMGFELCPERGCLCDFLHTAQAPSQGHASGCNARNYNSGCTR